MVSRNQKPRAIDAPEPCWLRMRLEPHGPYLPARIFHGTRPVSIGLSITGLLGRSRIAPPKSIGFGHPATGSANASPWRGAT